MQVPNEITYAGPIDLEKAYSFKGQKKWKRKGKKAMHKLSFVFEDHHSNNHFHEPLLSAPPDDHAHKYSL